MGADIQAFLYFTKAFKDFTPHVIGAMRLVANSYDPEELNLIGMGLYVSDFKSNLTTQTAYRQNEFKPDVVEWGQKGILQCSRILDQAKGPVTDQFEGPPEDLDVGPTRPSIKPVMSGGDVGLEEDEMGSPLSELPDLHPESKRAKVEEAGMSLEEYEAMLDAEDAEDGEGGFLEAGGILDP